MGVSIALGPEAVGACRAFANSEGAVDIARLVKGVNNALGGCSAG